MVVELCLWNKMIMASFGFRKVLREKKKIKENVFLIFGFTMKNTKENKI